MKRKLFLIIVLILGLNSFALGDNDTIPDTRLLPRLVDEANLLSDSEAESILSKLDSISESQNLDVAIITMDSLDGKDITESADDIFDYNGFGMGESYDGILFLISMSERESAISTHGYGIAVFTDNGQSYIMDQVVEYLSSGDYYNAFDTFANLSEEFIIKAKTDEPYDSHNLPKKSLSPVWIFISLGGGLIMALIVTGTMKSKLKTVRNKVSATDYMVANSLRLVESNDIFINKTVHKTVKEKKSSSSTSRSSGSSTHRSSSGRTHGGSKGKF